MAWFPKWSVFTYKADTSITGSLKYTEIGGLTNLLLGAQEKIRAKCNQNRVYQKHEINWSQNGRLSTKITCYEPSRLSAYARGSLD